MLTTKTQMVIFLTVEPIEFAKADMGVNCLFPYSHNTVSLFPHCQIIDSCSAAIITYKAEL